MIRRTGVLVVGASAAGLATVEALRRGGYRDPIALLGAEPHLPYDRPPLSKQILSGAWRPERTLLREPRRLAELDAGIVLGTRAVALDVAARTVHTATGSVAAEHIVIATGAVPRMLPAPPGLRGVHVLRTLDDALALRADLAVRSRVVVVGDGVLGAEIAATAGQSGHEVTMTGPQRAPMAAQLGDLAAGLLAGLHTGNGVRLRLGVGVSRLTDRGGEVTGVVLANAETLPADLVVVAIGAVPATDWLAGSGLSLADGVVCDARCRAAEGVYAVGDVARWEHPVLGRTLRLENRTNATEQAAAVAADILGARRAYQPIPYFWTDQFTTKIQVHGVITAGAVATIVDGDPDEGRFVARFEQGGDVTAVLGWNMPKQARMRRQELARAHALLASPPTPAHSP
ncbi:NAD(P)/FAD-dependent oxidoreductase [Nocardia sp. NPDC004085]